MDLLLRCGGRILRRWRTVEIFQLQLPGQLFSVFPARGRFRTGLERKLLIPGRQRIVGGRCGPRTPLTLRTLSRGRCRGRLLGNDGCRGRLLDNGRCGRLHQVAILARPGECLVSAWNRTLLQGIQRHSASGWVRLGNGLGRAEYGLVKLSGERGYLRVQRTQLRGGLAGRLGRPLQGVVFLAQPGALLPCALQLRCSLPAKRGEFPQLRG